MKRLRLSTLMLLVIVAAMTAALVVQGRKISRLEARSDPSLPATLPSTGSPFDMDPRPPRPAAPDLTDRASEPAPEPGKIEATPPAPAPATTGEAPPKALAVPSRTMPVPSSSSSVPLEDQIKGLDEQIRGLTKVRDRLELKARSTGIRFTPGPK
jgi:hypothetical protein